MQLSERESPRSMLHAPAPHDRYEDSFHITAIDNMIVSENHLEVSEYYSHHRALSARSCPPPRVAPRLHHATTLRLTPPRPHLSAPSHPRKKAQIRPPSPTAAVRPATPRIRLPPSPASRPSRTLPTRNQKIPAPPANPSEYVATRHHHQHDKGPRNLFRPPHRSKAA